MSNVSKTKVEQLLEGLKTEIDNRDKSINNQEELIRDLRYKAETFEEEKEAAEKSLNELETEIGENTHKIFGEEVTVLSNRIDINHFFETLAEVSKNFSPYQLEGLLKHVNR